MSYSVPLYYEMITGSGKGQTRGMADNGELHTMGMTDNGGIKTKLGIIYNGNTR